MILIVFLADEVKLVPHWGQRSAAVDPWRHAVPFRPELMCAEHIIDCC